MKKTNKQLSVDQEIHVACVTNGRRTKASGAASHDPGDVVTKESLIECKVTRGESISIKKSVWEKIRDECHSGKFPVMALRFVDDQDKPLYNLFVFSEDDLMGLANGCF